MQGRALEITLIDPRAPRTNQALVAACLLAAFLLDLPALLPAIAAILYVGVLLGRRWIPAYHLFFRLLGPRLARGKLEDERMPRFAQAMGATGIVVAWALIESGWPVAGWTLALSLAAAAAFAAMTGICLGCLSYRLMAKAGGLGRVRSQEVQLSDLGSCEAATGSHKLVAFTHPLCSDCHEWDDRLEREAAAVVRIDVGERPDLARKYGIALVPTIWEVDAQGLVLRQLAP